MKGLIPVALLGLCVGCGAAAPSAQPASASVWVGTWTGKVDWITPSDSSSNPGLGDSVTITIGTPVASKCPTASCTTAYTFQLTGTDTGPQLGNVNLTGTFVVYSDDMAGCSVGPSIAGKPYSAAIESQETWQLSGNSIAISGIGTNAEDQSISLSMGTLTKQ